MTKNIRSILPAALVLCLPGTASAICDNCGTVVEVKTIKKEGEGSGAGMVLGGVVGGVLGHQVGSGRGNTAATVLGAGAGAYAGHQIEKKNNEKIIHQVVIKMEDGKTRYWNFDNPPSYRAGDKVKIVDKKLMRQ